MLALWPIRASTLRLNRGLLLNHPEPLEGWQQPLIFCVDVSAALGRQRPIALIPYNCARQRLTLSRRSGQIKALNDFTAPTVDRQLVGKPAILKTVQRVEHAIKGCSMRLGRGHAPNTPAFFLRDVALHDAQAG